MFTADVMFIYIFMQNDIKWMFNDKNQNNNRHETTVEQLRPQFYLGRQIALVVDLVK